MKVLLEISSLFKQVDSRLHFINKANQENFVIRNNTMLHRSVQIRTDFFALKVCLSSTKILSTKFSNLENNSSTTRVLLFMTIPGHLTFVFLIWRLAADRTQISLAFICLYLIAALIQVGKNSFENIERILLFSLVFFRLLFFSILLSGWLLLFGNTIVIRTMSAYLI